MPILSLPIVLHGWVDWASSQDPEIVLEELLEKITQNAD